MLSWVYFHKLYFLAISKTPVNYRGFLFCCWQFIYQNWITGIKPAGHALCAICYYEVICLQPDIIAKCLFKYLFRQWNIHLFAFNQNLRPCLFIKYYDIKPLLNIAEYQLLFHRDQRRRIRKGFRKVN